MWSWIVYHVRRSLTFCLLWIYSKTLSASISEGIKILFSNEGGSIDIRPSYGLLMEARLEPSCTLYGLELSQL